MDAAVTKPAGSKVVPYQSLDKRLAKHNQGKGHIVIDNVSIRFHARQGVNTAVADANLDIKPGEFVCLLGPSGCGKSTLLNSVAGFVMPSEGSVTVDNKAITKPGPDRGMVFQQHSLFPWKTVLDNVAFGPLMSGSTRPQAEGVARTFLEVVGLSGYAKQYPSMLSGGMLQRVGIARALANYPSVLLMDEPFGALDAQTRSLMQENLLEIWQEFKNTVLFVTHDIEEAVYLADRVVVMSASPGKLIADIKVDLPRPRPVDVFVDPHFIEVKAQCMELIREETTRAFTQQNRTA